MSAKLLAFERDTESSSSGSFGSGLKHSEVAEQRRETEGSSGLSSSASSSVISLMTKEVVDWKEGPKQGTGEEAFELPGDNKSGVNAAEAEREHNYGWINKLIPNHIGIFFPKTTEHKSRGGTSLPHAIRKQIHCVLHYPPCPLCFP